MPIDPSRIHERWVVIQSGGGRISDHGTFDEAADQVNARNADPQDDSLYFVQQGSFIDPEV